MAGVKRFAVFDIDGTLIRWQLYHAIVDALAKGGKIDPERFASARSARMVWKNRTSDTSFKDYEHALIRTYDEAITSISYDDYLAAVEKVFDEYKGQTYTYTRELIKRLKAKDYLLFAISASQSEVVELLASHYGFTDWAASIYEARDGKFTGKKQVILGAQKPKALEVLVKKHSASYEGSIAVGDSDSDIPMLKSVDHPIAFNPNKLLFQTAKAAGWKVVVERKNMTYELEPSDGKYLLA